MPHIHTKPGEHDHTASAYIVRTDFDEPKLLLHLHRKLGVYMQFGGHIETTENPWTTVLQELREESGYESDQLMVLQPKDRFSLTSKEHQARFHPIPMYHVTFLQEDPTISKDSTHHHTDLGYVFIANGPPAHKEAKGESSDSLLLTYQELVDLPAEKTFETVREPGLFALSVAIEKWQAVSVEDFS